MTDNIIIDAAEVIVVKQMQSDNSIRVTFGLPEDALEIMAQLAACKQQGIVLRLEITEVQKSNKSGW